MVTNIGFPPARPAAVPPPVRPPPRLGLYRSSSNDNGKNICIYIYIYRERERERESCDRNAPIFLPGQYNSNSLNARGGHV